MDSLSTRVRLAAVEGVSRPGVTEKPSSETLRLDRGQEISRISYPNLAERNFQFHERRFPSNPASSASSVLSLNSITDGSDAEPSKGVRTGRYQPPPKECTSRCRRDWREHFDSPGVLHCPVGSRRRQARRSPECAGRKELWRDEAAAIRCSTQFAAPAQ